MTLYQYIQYDKANTSYHAPTDTFFILLEMLKRRTLDFAKFALTIEIFVKQCSHYFRRMMSSFKMDKFYLMMRELSNHYFNYRKLLYVCQLMMKSSLLKRDEKLQMIHYLGIMLRPYLPDFCLHLKLLYFHASFQMDFYVNNTHQDQRLQEYWRVYQAPFILPTFYLPSNLPDQVAHFNLELKLVAALDQRKQALKNMQNIITPGRFFISFPFGPSKSTFWYFRASPSA